VAVGLEDDGDDKMTRASLLFLDEMDECSVDNDEEDETHDSFSCSVAVFCLDEFILWVGATAEVGKGVTSVTVPYSILDVSEPVFLPTPVVANVPYK
jgi:hypothetical protein